MYKFVSRSTPRISDQRKFIDAHSFSSCVNVEQPCSVLRVAVSDSRSLAKSLGDPEPSRCAIRLAGHPRFSATLPKNASSAKFSSSSEGSSVVGVPNSKAGDNSPAASTASSDACNGKGVSLNVHLPLDVGNGKQTDDKRINSAMSHRAVRDLTDRERQLGDRLFIVVLVMFILWVSIFFPVMLFVSNPC
uniref:Uncharacterized protein n=1 Tax=Trichuris muris TaxID=70415 RepID=A0A5S6QCH5_TRIMR